MQPNLWLLRAKSFGVNIIGFVVGALALVATLPGFADLVHQYFGTGIFASLVLLAIPELIKQFLNVRIVEQAKLGGVNPLLLPYQLY